jgi:hypothetical protein
MEDKEGLDSWGSACFAEEEQVGFEDSFGSNELSSTWSLPDMNAPSEIPVRTDLPGARRLVSVCKYPGLLHSVPRVKKGWGPESRAKAPDPHDFYDFQRSSEAYVRLRVMGYQFFTLADIVHIGSRVEDLLLSMEKPMTERNRAARRRKPNAFHWLDENWPNISPDMFKIAVMAVLGDPSRQRIRRRHGVKP